MSDYMPSALERVDFTNLSKGMVTTVPPASMPEGTFRRVKDMYATAMGPQRRDSWRLMFPTKTNFARVPIDVSRGEKVYDIEGFFDPNNNLQLLAFSSLRLYVNKVGDSFDYVYFGKSPYTITAINKQIITCAAATFVTDRVRPRDVVVLSIGGVRKEFHVSSVDSETQITLDADATGAAAPLNVIREFANPLEDMVDYTFMPKAIAIVDGSPRGIWKYDGTHLVDMCVVGAQADITAGDGNYLLGAATIMFFAGYLIVGNTIENYKDSTSNNALDQKRTLRWSSVTKINEFAIIDYVIFSKETSGILKITSIEECPFAILGNAIYYGTASTLDGLPYAYNRLEMGAVSAVGKRAVSSVPGGIVFIAQKNIYFVHMGTDGTRVPIASPIGDEIYNEACYNTNDPKFERVLFAPSRNSLVCTFPKLKKHVGRMFMKNYDTGGWSYIDDESSRFTAANVFPYYLILRWSDMDNKTWNDEMQDTWFSLKLEDYTSRLFVVDEQGYIYVADDSFDYDSTVSADGTKELVSRFNAQLETGDYEFGSPGYYKAITQIYLTVADTATNERTTDLNVLIEVSMDRGKTWKAMDTLVIENGTYFEDLYLRNTAQTFRFRLTFGNTSEPFILTEIGVRFRRLGNYSQRGV